MNSINFEEASMLILILSKLDLSQGTKYSSVKIIPLIILYELYDLPADKITVFVIAISLFNISIYEIDLNLFTLAYAVLNLLLTFSTFVELS